MTAGLTIGELFQRIHSDAARMLCGVGGHDGPCYNASIIAARAVKDLTSRARPRRLTDPGNGWRGGLLESVYIVTPEGRIVIHQYHLPPWNWHRKVRALIANRKGNGQRYVGSFGGMRGLRADYEMWNGVNPLYYSATMFDDEGLVDLGVCIATRYSTTRHGTLERYIHVHSSGVRAYESPYHVVVRGGGLDATPKGLIR